jgi:phospholipid transport system substrate-binding protein
LAPAVERAFDLAAMTRFAVGPQWAAASEADRAALIKAFTRLTLLTYAKNFDRYAGERIDVTPQPNVRGLDKIVRTKLTSPRGAGSDLAYRLRQSGGAWKIIDVYYNGSISQLTVRRSDFAATLAAGGAPALIRHLNALSDKLTK